MLAVAARIPDAAARDQFADRLAHKARITEEVVRAEIRKAAVQRRTTLENRNLPALGQVKPAERGLIWALMRTPADGVIAMAELEDGDLEGLASRAILEQARSLQGWPAESLPQTLLQRLNTGEAGLVTDIAAQPEAPVRILSDCVLELRKLRLLRERAAVERQLTSLLEQGVASHDRRIDELGTRQIVLRQQIEAIDQRARG